MLIKRTTSCGQITFVTKVFGRGTDFVCRDRNVISNGGVHVIQTFFSEEVAEETQIMGRTARQGKDGSYSLVLLDSDLEKYLGTDYLKQIEDMRKIKKTYEVLDQKRRESFNVKYAGINKCIQKAKEEHIMAQKFIEHINTKKIDLVKYFLKDRNTGASCINHSRTICLMDATGSMGNLLNQVKNTVVTMFERASIILNDHAFPPDSFQVQFAVYRDYDCNADGLLQYSPWETKPDNLRKFMESIKPEGGGDYPEAIEIGLRHANNEFDNGCLSQVILIEDAPAKSKQQILNDRNKYNGEEYWKNTPFAEATYFETEISKLKKNKIPVHSFYLHEGAKKNFKEISGETGGRCQSLDINSDNGSELLANVITGEILRSVGLARGEGDALVDAYQQRFSKAYVK